jgi:hypothetical protein
VFVDVMWYLFDAVNTRNFVMYLPQKSPGILVSYPMDTGGSFSGVKQQRLEADHSPPSSAQIKNGGAVPPLPICLHGIVLN